jgi:flavin-dependent dehydrogenase
VSPAPERFDAIVVGAGPAGSTAARHLAEAGASVLLLDRARFPRDKPCGGGVTVRAARRLPFSLAPVVEGAVDTLEVSVGYARRFARTRRAPSFATASR